MVPGSNLSFFTLKKIFFQVTKLILVNFAHLIDPLGVRGFFKIDNCFHIK